MELGQARERHDELDSFVVTVSWVFFKKGGARAEMMQFVDPKDITHTRFQVSGEYIKRQGQPQFRVLSIYSEHDVSFLNGASRTRLRGILKAKIDAVMAPMYVPNMAMNIIILDASKIVGEEYRV
jgi:hypothetical protein